ncbi:MAG: hypothetical protein IT174_02530 [Acidobacteria bacterium]|nr:hypothetical protein [Acidobacteriota bacterium]
MIETTSEGHRILIGSDGSRQFMIDSDRIDACIEYIERHDMRTIGINSFLGYKKAEINFLSEIADFVEGIIVSDYFSDMSVLNDLYKLKTLGFRDNKKSVINLSNFPDLSTLACEYSKRLLSLESCEQLRDLTLTNFKPQNNTLEEVPRLSSLKRLSLFVTNINSLVGIGKFPQITELTIFRANKLKDISALKDVSRTLTNLEFDACKRIENYYVLGDLRILERLIIGASAPISSLSFVRLLPRLDFLSFVGTNVVDGDLSLITGIGYVGFENRRHYSHTFEEIANFRNR